MHTTYDLIFLGDDEWDNATMCHVAAEWFQRHPQCQFVMVYEHAGWHLTYHRAELECVGSANDQAFFRAGIPRPTGYSGRSERRGVRQCECGCRPSTLRFRPNGHGGYDPITLTILPTPALIGASQPAAQAA